MRTHPVTVKHVMFQVIVAFPPRTPPIALTVASGVTVWAVDSHPVVSSRFSGLKLVSDTERGGQAALRSFSRGDFFKCHDVVS